MLSACLAGSERALCPAKACHAPGLQEARAKCHESKANGKALGTAADGLGVLDEAAVDDQRSALADSPSGQVVPTWRARLRNAVRLKRG